MSRAAVAGALALLALVGADSVADPLMVKRFPENPIIRPEMDPSIGTNINGPSLIRVPKWVEHRLGAYYLYFADHNGKFIRLAYADRLEGPWKIHKPGALQLAESHFTDHVASPDVVVDEERRQIRLYYHGLSTGERAQHTRVALSKDGLAFTAVKEPVGRGTAYWRVFHCEGLWYALAMPGKLYRSKDGITPFEEGPQLFPPQPTQVHNAVLVRKDRLSVFYTRAGDSPERILYSEVPLTEDWRAWKPTAPEECLTPKKSWEGADLPVTPARIGALDKPSHALRDPAVYLEGDKVYLLYAVAGESGIAIAEVEMR